MVAKRCPHAVGVAGGRTPVRPRGPYSCAGERGGPGGCGSSLQQPTNGVRSLVFHQSGNLYDHLRPGHPERIRAKRFLLFFRADPDQPGDRGGHPLLHLHGPPRRGKRYGHRHAASGAAENRSRRHQLSHQPRHPHSWLREPPRDPAGGGVRGFRRWRVGADHHVGPRRARRSGLSWRYRCCRIRGSSFSVRAAPEQSAPLKLGPSAHGNAGGRTDYFEGHGVPRGSGDFWGTCPGGTDTRSRRVPPVQRHPEPGRL